jgi:UDP-N-acetylglucosamine 2-epimerase (non-hydrolysing)
MKKKLFFVLGTRPEFIKLAPLIVAAKNDPRFEVFVCSSGQHREVMIPIKQFFGIEFDHDLSLMKPNQNLVDLHANAMLGVKELLIQHKPDVVIVQGDTTTAQAAAVSAYYLQIPVTHVEAGLRTFDLEAPFPEEFNRRVIGVFAKWHFAPTSESQQNLFEEKLSKHSIVEVTGNTGIDALILAAEKLKDPSLRNSVVDSKLLNLSETRKKVLCTVHRRESFGEDMKNIFTALLKIAQESDLDLIIPLHPNPNVRAAADEIFASEMNKTVFKEWPKDDPQAGGPQGRLLLCEPLDYPSLVYIMEKSEFIITDSGGIQEEAPTFGKKILVLRKTTERPEGVTAGFAELLGADTQLIVSKALHLNQLKDPWLGEVPPLNPYGDGKSSQKILDSLINHAI